MKRVIAGAIIALTLSAFGAVAQESTNRVAANTDWSVFVEDNPTECWSVSSPKETVNTRDGRAVAAKRGEILLFVSYRPGSKVKGQAWAAPADDAKIVSSMKRGASAILQAQSSRGTKTKDTFSLLGFTAAVDEAGKRCGG